MLKQVQFFGKDNKGQIFCQPLTDDGLIKTASANSRSNLHPQIADFVKTVRPSKHGIYVLVNAMGAGEYWGSNINGDHFAERELIHAPSDWEKLSIAEMKQKGKEWDSGFPTFMGAHPYKHHVNKDSSRAFGSVEIATWNPKMRRVELVVYLDRALCKKFDAYDVIERIERGEFPDVSMGCKVPYDICSICLHRSKTPKDYCNHAKNMMNKILSDGRKVFVYNPKPRFFDISFVFIGADKTAKVMAKLASRGAQVCMGEYCVVPRLSADVAEHFSKEAYVPLTKTQIGGGAVGSILGGLAGHKAGDWLGKKSDEFYQDHGIGWKGKAEEIRQKLLRGSMAVGGSSLGAIAGGAAAEGLKHLIKHAAAEEKKPEIPTRDTNPEELDTDFSLYDPSFNDFVQGKGHTQLVQELKAAKPEFEKKIYPPAQLEANDSYTALVNPDAAKTKVATSGSKNLSLKIQETVDLGSGVKLHHASGDNTDNKFTTHAVVLTHEGLKGPIAHLSYKVSPENSIALISGLYVHPAFRSIGAMEELLTATSYIHPNNSFVVKPDPWKDKSTSVEDLHRLYKKNGFEESKTHKGYLERSPRESAHKEKIANDPIKKFVHVQGIPIMLEWLKGETRKYKSGFSQKMKADYGYIPATMDADGEQLDVYLGRQKDSELIFIVNQLKDDGSFDERKVMIGYEDEEAAKKSYLQHMPEKRLGKISRTTISIFKKNHLTDAKEAKKTQPHEKVAEDTCECHGLGDDCGGSAEKVAHAVFPGMRNSEKSASHRKVSELIKSIPAGPFSKETLPKLERSEREIPQETLDRMGEMDLKHSLSTPAMMGIVLKPREFQRVMLVRIGEKSLADELDRKGEVFGPSSEVDESLDISPDRVHHLLKELLQAMGFFRDRSAVSFHLSNRMEHAKPDRSDSSQEKTASVEPLLRKLSSAYNGYRRSIIKKAAIIEKYLVSDPQLAFELFDGSMAQAFAGGISKTASPSVFSPDSLAYLTGAYHENRDLHIADAGVRASLAQMGTLSGALS